MDTRDTPEQAELGRTARRLAREPGPRAVADLADRTRADRLGEAVRDAGWLELRHDGGGGDPPAGGGEAAVLARAPGGAGRPSSPTRWARPSSTFPSRARSSPRISPAAWACTPATARGSLPPLPCPTLPSWRARRPTRRSSP